MLAGGTRWLRELFSTASQQNNIFLEILHQLFWPLQLLCTCVWYMRIFCLSIDISTTQNLFKGIINHHLNASNIPILNYLSSIACKKGNSYNGSFQTLHCKWLTTRQVIVIFTSTQNNTKVFEHFKSFIFQKQCSHLSLVIRCKHLAIMALKIQSLTELPQF